MQVTAYGRQTVPDRGVVRSCDPIQNFGGSNHITGTTEPKVVKFCTRVGYINSNNRMTYHQQKGRGYGHVTFKILPFVVMQRVARVCQRQLSYLCNRYTFAEVMTKRVLFLDTVYIHTYTHTHHHHHHHHLFVQITHQYDHLTYENRTGQQDTNVH